MQAIRALRAPLTRETRGLIRKDVQQKRFMSGDDEPGVHRVNWWDAPQDPNVWQKHQLAWWTIGFYYSIYYLVSGGSKEEQPPAKA
ncbi:hypothetical protein DUNSADRAFT_11911 [Dunaliella salina]|uniref:Uncharacterized protein n=1 Tax=Dunaliella salina TaxID=3046 RepID=A0ABQ7GCE0_DUNSA|nr:hypothetical protein DUNSADRAFT_11911 [Dunaliella salina]|eukprot:KAF5832268.1 hypothetical protein DUNSADRAFT_11911 [Dunaliella salina]